MPTDTLIHTFEKVKPIVLLSQCLVNSACRYDGDRVKDAFVNKLKKYVKFVSICPEVAIGLGVPRDPIRLVEATNRQILIQPATGRQLTKKMNSFSKSFVNSLTAVDGVILKSRSPSCAVGDSKIFRKADSMKHFKRSGGLFANAAASFFAGLPIADEQTLKDTRAREHFLVRLFTIARFRIAADVGALNCLRQFHEKHRDLFETYNKRSLAVLDSLLLTVKHTNKSGTATAYRVELYRMFARRTNRGHDIKKRYYPDQLH